MKTDKLIDAIGQIDENKIRDAKVVLGKIKMLSFKRVIALVAVIILCITISVPVLAATVDPVYLMLYRVSPSLAQMLKPVQLSCEDNGIKMEVESAYIHENEANIVVSMQDLEGNRIDQTIDLYDSYRINRPFDSTGSCRRLDYDEETGKATFLITISQWGNKDIGGDKITLYVREFLSHKQKFDGEIPLDLSTVTTATKMQKKYYTGMGFNSMLYAEEEIREELCLVPSDDYGKFVVDGIELTGYGYIDGKFHIQVGIPNRLENDNHGSFYVFDENGEKRYCDYHISWKETVDETVITYEEYIFDIPMEEMKKQKLYGEFITSKGTTKGNWQVTFPLENMN